MNIACQRCDRVTTVVVTDDDNATTIENADVDVGEGMLLYVCGECMTDEEVVFKARQSAVAMLDAAEQATADLQMVAERVPVAADDPTFKRTLMETQRWAEAARAALQALDDAS